MSDQAEKLRNRLRNLSQQQDAAKTVAVASGKGGVGKSNFTINFALKLIQNGKNVLIIDFDIGMGNIDILLGVSPEKSFIDLFNDSTSTIEDIVEQGPNGLSYISGGSGLREIFTLNGYKSGYFTQQFTELVDSYDFILFDMGAGVTKDSLYFMASADEVIVVTTPEPTSITDAYAVIKHLMNYVPDLPIRILTNRIVNQTSGKETFNRLEKVAMKFMNKSITHLGSMPDDRKVMSSVLDQVPFVIREPKCSASKAVHKIAEDYLHVPSHNRKNSFLSKLKSFVTER
ncbi:flagellum site-determining protein YlxH [Halobacillus andaensis]|uniref:Flagellum site-determining protein YlxH n=1 Tax=Halobacillus andaensis TaxID=1176239 RepID=A0A917AYX3_HALAA|nr:MinD/ParA family protein [Halobacillus andaensis]MBP2003476.1 flagellar biosynthesis protein FlhG [Halobacillus andaensis]GGF10911.1 flagellum site-determining protein YlxH [Halobacillus andaensis]